MFIQYRNNASIDYFVTALHTKIRQPPRKLVASSAEIFIQLSAVVRATDHHGGDRRVGAEGGPGMNYSCCAHHYNQARPSQLSYEQAAEVADLCQSQQHREVEVAMALALERAIAAEALSLGIGCISHCYSQAHCAMLDHHVDVRH